MKLSFASLSSANLLFLTTLFTTSIAATPLQFETNLFVDTRLAVASGESSWLDSQLGKGRYGGNADGSSKTKVEFSEVSLLTDVEINWDTKAFVHIKYDPEQDTALDLVESYLSYTPVPRSSIKFALKAGLFFPHISRENIDIAWTSPFTISSSAINSWIGEEIRALGIEGKMTHRLESGRLSLTGSIFGYNDPAGTLLAFRGWGIGDTKAGIVGSLPLAPLPTIGMNGSFVPQSLEVSPIREIDNRPGFYNAIDWAGDNGLQIGALYYDNRGDPTVLDHDGQYAWDTRFWSLYLEKDIYADIKIISQYLFGTTEMGEISNGQRIIDIDYNAAFILATTQIDEYRFTSRIDWFSTTDNSFTSIENNDESGRSITLAASTLVTKNTSIIAEFLHIESTRPARQTIAVAPKQSNNFLQVSYRAVF